MPLGAQWGGHLRGKGFRPAKPTLTWASSNTFTITNYNPAYTYATVSGTRTGASLAVTQGVTASLTASQGLTSDTATATTQGYSYSPGGFYDCSYTTNEWRSCGCECGGGGCGCYGYSSGSWGQCGCPGSMCWYNWGPVGHPQTCQYPSTLNPVPGYTNSGNQWYLTT